MSELKLISPMLDNFIVGDAISDHHGVRCYPAMENETNDRFIIKVISVPATPSKLDALLLTGAYSDKASALDYFKEIADGVIQEVDTLEKLAALEGFLAFSDCQMVPMESGDGYDIYLKSTYKRTLQKHFRRHNFTHLDALNLGLDLCAALSVCRRSGYLFVDLKPSNVFVTDQRLFRIGDLGFLSLDSLKYASVPEKYLSEYTPPEIRDAFSDLNTTMDTYAAGLILYQAYNNGALPFNDDILPGDPLPAPMYADYEMGEIILKACAPNPDDRWQDPMQMGQAIISYMQRNGAKDVPIVPMPGTEEAAAEEIPAPALTVEDAPAAEPVAEEIPSAEVSVEETPVEETLAEETSAEETNEEAVPAEETLTEETPAEEPNEEEVPVEEFLIEEVLTEESIAEETPADEPAAEEAAEEVPEDADDFEEDVPQDYESITEEVTEMLEYADELAAMEVPEPVVVPDHVDIPMPEPPVPEEEPEASENAEEPAAEQAAEETAETDDQTATPKVKRNFHWVRNGILALLAIVLIAGGVFFYKNYYLQPIEFITVEGKEDTLTVYVTTKIDESKLQVVCSDYYGNKLYAPVIDGKAEFTDLVSNTAYSIKVVSAGFHKLTGSSSTAYSTPVLTNVVQFDAVAGATDDSVILSFTVEGPDSKEWTVEYSAEGEQTRAATFTSHMVTLTNLTVGKEYTFRLVPDKNLFVTGTEELVFTTRKLVKAENLQVVSCADNALTVQWSVPEGATVESWSVRCANDAYDQTIITTTPIATFRDLDHTQEFVIDVKAVGMSVSQTATVSANSVTAMNFKGDQSVPGKITFSWSPNGELPDGDLLLRYSIIGIENELTIPCNGNTVEISPVIPGATYRVQVEDAKGEVLLGSKNEIVMDAAEDFTMDLGSDVAKKEDLEFSMLKTPKFPDWGRYDLTDDDYTNAFAVGDKISYLVRFDKLQQASDDTVEILYVIRNADGATILHSSETSTWEDMWATSYCKLNVPVMPGTAGDYTIEIYFNGALANSQTFTIS